MSGITREDVIKVMLDVLNLPRDQVDTGMQLFRDMAVSEVELIEIEIAIEDAFGFSIDTDKLDKEQACFKDLIRLATSEIKRRQTR